MVGVPLFCFDGLSNRSSDIRMSYLARIAEVYQGLAFSRQELAYYARHVLLPGVGTPGQKKLKAARVLVVGAGGLGCPVLQGIVGAGAGYVTVIDGDSVEWSNLSRQWLHGVDTVGQNKAKSAQRALAKLNPFVCVEARAEMLNVENAQALIAAHDLVVDATDNLEVRYLIDEQCDAFDRPWVHAALYRDRSQLSVFWARYGASFRALFPERSEASSCAAAGVLGAAAAMVGHLQALEVVKLITGCAEPSVGQLLSVNSATVEVQRFSLPGLRGPELFKDEEVLPEHAMSLDALRQAYSIGLPLRVLDIRSRGQFAQSTLPDAVHCEVDEIFAGTYSFDPKLKTVLFCEQGDISGLVVDALRARGSDMLFHLEGGYHEWAGQGEF